MIRTLWFTTKSNLSDVFEDLFDEVKNVQGRTALIGTDDVVLFDGGTDVDSQWYGEERHPFAEAPDVTRDEFERLTFRRAQAAGAACIGICRGAQLLCVLSGGKLIQDVAGHRNNNHDIYTEDGRKIVAAADHHQMMYPQGVFHELLAWAPPGTGTSNCEYGKDIPDPEPEIIWVPDTRSLCIQPHPEWMSGASIFQDYCRELAAKYILNHK